MRSSFDPPDSCCQWSTPKVAELLTSRTGTTLNLTTSIMFVDFDLGAIDLAIRYFDGNDAALKLELLSADNAHVSRSPVYAKKLNLKRPADLRPATHLHNTLHSHWSSWHSGRSDDVIESIAPINFDQSLIALDPPFANKDLVIASSLLTQTETKSGALVESFRLMLPLNTAYYLAHPKSIRLKAGTLRVKEWPKEAVRVRE